MKKMIAALAALVMMGFMLVGTAGSASATGDHPSPDNKKVTLCHATGSQSNPYTKITVSVMAFYQAGHINHNGDIWEAFSYTTVGGQTVNVPARGDTSLLEFDNCVRPKVDEPVTRPEAVFNDPCGTTNDVFSVAPGRGYTVSGIVMEGNNQVITATLEDGFKWSTGGDAYNPIRFVRPAFTDVDCGTPNTGGNPTGSTAGLIALGGAVLMGGATLLTGRRRRSLI